jgi:hypothetical protein
MVAEKNNELVLEFDDFHWLAPENCLAVIKRFTEAVPSIKLTMFTVPFLRGNALFANPEWCREVAELCGNGNLEIARHGCSHAPLEYEHCNYDYAIKSLLLGNNILETSGIPYVRVFRGPYWGLNSDTVRALNELGYTHLFNHRDHSAVGKAFNGKVVFYNWNLGQPAPAFRFLVGHGHTHDVCGNGIEQTFDRIMNVISERNPTFLFSSEV